MLLMLLSLLFSLLHVNLVDFNLVIFDFVNFRSVLGHFVTLEYLDFVRAYLTDWT